MKCVACKNEILNGNQLFCANCGMEMPCVEFFMNQDSYSNWNKLSTKLAELKSLQENSIPEAEEKASQESKVPVVEIKESKENNVPKVKAKEYGGLPPYQLSEALSYSNAELDELFKSSRSFFKIRLWVYIVIFILVFIISFLPANRILIGEFLLGNGCWLINILFECLFHGLLLKDLKRLKSGIAIYDPSKFKYSFSYFKQRFEIYGLASPILLALGVHGNSISSQFFFMIAICQFMGFIYRGVISSAIRKNMKHK